MPLEKSSKSSLTGIFQTDFFLTLGEEKWNYCPDGCWWYLSYTLCIEQHLSYVTVLQSFPTGTTNKKYCRRVQEANLSIFQQEVQSVQHWTWFWWGVFLLSALLFIGYLVCSMMLTLWSLPMLLDCFYHCVLMKSAVLDNWGSVLHFSSVFSSKICLSSTSALLAAPVVGVKCWRCPCRPLCPVVLAQWIALAEQAVKLKYCFMQYFIFSGSLTVPGSVLLVLL